MWQRTLRLPYWLSASILLLTLAIGTAAGSLSNDHHLFAATAVKATAPAAPETSGPATSLSNDANKSGAVNSYASAVQKVMPSIVNVFSSKKVPNERIVQPFLDDPFFRRFFGDDLPNNRQPRERQERSLGSGVIVSKDGYILTNNHVVDDATDVKVSLNDKREFTAKVVGRDSKTDLAVLKIDQGGLPTVAFGDSTKLQVGDVVLAIGNPFGVGQTVTMGVVSAMGRGGLGIEEYEDFIQTDAAINPGNSGGALINPQGELVGINTAILSRSGGNQGIGFAIPASLARNVMDQIITGGKVTRAFLGVMIQPVTPDIAKAFKVPRNEGALIADVSPSSPAERAGLKAGDVITKVDGQSISDSRALQLLIAQMKPGRSVHVSILRDGSERDYSVTLGEQPGDKSEASSTQGNASPSDRVLDGVSLEAMTPELGREFGNRSAERGVLVRRIDRDSAAAEAGLAQGDVILEVNRHAVSTPADVKKYIEESNADSTILFVNRDGRTHYVVVPSH